MVENYSKTESNIIDRFNEKHFGRCQEINYGIGESEYPVDIQILRQDQRITLVTKGMGCHAMKAPDSQFTYIELIFQLSANWDLAAKPWPLSWLRTLAYLPLHSVDYLAWGHTVSNDDFLPFDQETDLAGIIVFHPDDQDKPLVCDLGQKQVEYLEVLALYKEEIIYKQNYGTRKLRELIKGKLAPLNLKRPNYGLKEKLNKNYLHNWPGPSSCLVSAKIIEDKQKIGCMYRVSPGANSLSWDSGWRFVVGDEEEAYFQEPDRVKVMTLNDLCNLDQRVIRYLYYPYGTVFHKGSRGFTRGVNRDFIKRQEILGAMDIAYLEELKDGSIAGYDNLIEALEATIKESMEMGKYKDSEIVANLDIALWYSYALQGKLNYEDMYLSKEVLLPALVNALGCGEWYCQYTIAAIFCGKLYQALDFCGKGLEQSPQDSELLLLMTCLQRYFKVEGESNLLSRIKDEKYFLIRDELERAIDNDEKLDQLIGRLSFILKGNPEPAKLKDLCRGILINDNQLTKIKELFAISSWIEKEPYCKWQGQNYRGTFKMNEAYLSQIDIAYLTKVKKVVDQEKYQKYFPGFELKEVAVGRNDRIEMYYQHPAKQAAYLMIDSQENVLSKYMEE